MPVLAYAGVAGAILYLVYYMINRAKADAVLVSLRRADRTKEAEELGKLTEEVANAKIHYNKSRADYDALISKRAALLPDGTGSVPEGPAGS